jgi:hypothetical protein
LEGPGIRKSVLSAAKKHLEDEYAAFGVTERFSESLDMITNVLGWEAAPLGQKKAAYPDRPTVDDLAREQVDELRTLNALDVELYSFASDLFDRTMS